jgi:hypothetical protein
MTWVRLDDGFPRHPKVRDLSDRAFRVLVTLWCDSGQYLTNGEISASSARDVVGRSKALDELVSKGLAQVSDGADGLECGTVTLHDFLEYNPSRQDVLGRRKAERERKRRWREEKMSRRDSPRDSKDVSRRDSALPDPTRPISVGTESSSGSSTTNSRKARRSSRAVSTPGENGKAPREPDPIWDGFAEWLGRQPETRSERGAWNSAAKELREIGADPADIVNRGRAYERNYPTITWTPNGLVKHWSELVRPPWVAIRPTQEAPPETCDYGEGVVCGRCGSIHGPLTVS